MKLTMLHSLLRLKKQCGMIISATHLVEGREGLNVLILDDKIPAGAKLY